MSQKRMGLAVGGFLYFLFLLPLLPHRPPLGFPAPLPFSAWNGYAHMLSNLMVACPFAVLLTNALLILLTGLLLISPRRPPTVSNVFYGPAVPLLAFLLNPVVLLRTVSGFQGEPLFVPVFLTGFIALWSGVEYWSAFMRAFVLAVLTAVGVWIYIPAAVWILEAMVPWAFFNRRPLPAFWAWIGTALGGAVIFVVTWVSFCLLTHHRGAFRDPFLEFPRYLSQEHRAGSLWTTLEIFSPFGAVLLLWKGVAAFQRMLREHRSGVVEFAGFLTLILAWVNGQGEDYSVSLAAAGFLFLGAVLLREIHPSRHVRRLEAFLITGMAVFFLYRDVLLWRRG